MACKESWKDKLSKWKAETYSETIVVSQHHHSQNYLKVNCMMTRGTFINRVVKLSVTVCVIQTKQKFIARFIKLSETLISFILAFLYWSPVKSNPCSRHMIHLHVVTPTNLHKGSNVQTAGSMKQMTAVKPKKQNWKIFSLEMNDEDKGWKAEVDVYFFTHVYGNKNMQKYIINHDKRVLNYMSTDRLSFLVN